MTDKLSIELAAMSAHLASRRDAILLACRQAAKADPEQTTVKSLTRAQFNDHLPQVLDAFERVLRGHANGNGFEAANNDKKQEEVKHGLHRWQQGYRLRELLHEWGHMHICLYDEIEIFAAANPEIDQQTLVVAHRELITLVNEAVSESTGQYARMQQDEAAGHARDLERALEQLSAVERQRAHLIHQAVHDLRGNVQSVASAADILKSKDLANADRIAFSEMIQQGTQVVTTMLGDLMVLARLEAGQDSRNVASFDGGKLLAELCAQTQSVARDKNLVLEVDGPAILVVEGDESKVRRIVQNLVLNALKYTIKGKVAVSWGEEGTKSWWIIVKDTGPGIVGGPAAPMVVGLKEGTESARESDERASTTSGEKPSVVALPQGDPGTESLPQKQNAGEGIGLSIVKRLCELLDASLELVSSKQSGTTFRVVLPKNYG